jgi:hypothetical protein
MTASPAVTPLSPSLHNPTRHIAARVTAVIMLVVGGLAIVSAIGLLAVFGTSSRLTTGQQQLTSSASAIVTDITRIQNTRGVAGVTEWPTLNLSVRGGDASGMFVGIGPADEVDRYLAGSAVDWTTDLNLAPFTLRVARQLGTAIPAPPAAQPFWVASASSRSDATLTWPVQDGNYRVVVMNADGAAGLRTAADLSLTLPRAFALSVGILTAGAAVAIGGVVVIIRTATNRRRSAYGPTPRRTDAAPAP